MYTNESKKQALKLAVMKRSKTVPADLLVCFPSRAHLALMPKQINSPARTSDAAKRAHHRPANSPLFKSKTSSEIHEPTSPKVTCAGQIKSRPKSRPGPRAQPKPHWFGCLAFKKEELLHYVSSFRGLRFNLQCFGSIHDPSSDDDNEVDEVDEDSNSEERKWFLMLDEKEKIYDRELKGEERECAALPPPNVLLLMRSRSTPAKGRIKELGEEDLYNCEISRETWVNGASLDVFSRSKSWKR